MKIESRTVQVQKSAQEVCNFLSDVKNFKQLMPENTTKFEIIGEQAFVFALKGMPEIALELKEINAPQQVVLGAKSDKLPFTLTGNITEQSAELSQVGLVFEGQFNAMMGMMIKGPITSFLGNLIDNLEQL